MRNVEKESVPLSPFLVRQNGSSIGCGINSRNSLATYFIKYLLFLESVLYRLEYSWHCLAKPLIWGSIAKIIIQAAMNVGLLNILVYLGDAIQFYLPGSAWYRNPTRGSSYRKEGRKRFVLRKYLVNIYMRNIIPSYIDTSHGNRFLLSDARQTDACHQCDSRRRPLFTAKTMLGSL